MTSSIPYGTPTGLYLIIETINPKPGFPSLVNTIGISDKQIYRVVLQIYNLSDIYIDGELMTDNLSLWQRVKGAFGIGVTTRPTGERALHIEYAGFPNIIQPLPEIGNLVPKALTDEITLPAHSPYIFGVDPLPSIKLYANPQVVFLMPNGGRSVPTAMAKYNRVTGELVMLNTMAQVDQAKRDIGSQVPVLRF